MLKRGVTRFWHSLANAQSDLNGADTEAHMLNGSFPYHGFGCRRIIHSLICQLVTVLCDYRVLKIFFFTFVLLRMLTAFLNWNGAPINHPSVDSIDLKYAFFGFRP